MKCTKQNKQITFSTNSGPMTHDLLHIPVFFNPRRSHNSSNVSVVLAQWPSSFSCITLTVFYNEYRFIQKSLCFLTLCILNCTTGLITVETANENVKRPLIPLIANATVRLIFTFSSNLISLQSVTIVVCGFTCSSRIAH